MPHDGPGAVPPLSLAAVRLTCRDLETSRAFYGDVLGLPLRSAAPDWLVFDVDGIDLVVEPGEAGAAEQPPRRYAGFSFAVEDAAAVCDALSAQGVEVVGRPEVQPWGGTLAHVADPAGNVLTFVQYPPQA